VQLRLAWVLNRDISTTFVTRGTITCACYITPQFPNPPSTTKLKLELDLTRVHFHSRTGIDVRLRDNHPPIPRRSRWS